LVADGVAMVVALATSGAKFREPYFAALVVLMFCPRVGHIVAARRHGLTLGLKAYIPVRDVWYDIVRQPVHMRALANIALAGIAGGFLGAMALLVAWLVSGEPVVLAATYAGFFLCLANLLPLTIFDGGRMTLIVTSRLWLVGVPIVGLLLLVQPNPMLWLFILAALPALVRSFRREPDVLGLGRREKMAYGLTYLVLAVFAAVMTFELHTELRALIPLR
jgi:Zn-dependent protease